LVTKKNRPPVPRETRPHKKQTRLYGRRQHSLADVFNEDKLFMF